MSNLVNSCECGGCTCGCCEGVKVVTPVSTANPPGLPALAYRAGTHATFFESMIAGLTTSGDPQLPRLGTRSLDDAAIAFLDGWATIADILTFYQERIANEGYLCTAVQRRSVLELARLIGYRMRPGVAASAYLAYTIDSQYSGDAIIPAGTRSTSIPGPGEQQQTFETSDDLRARASWNLLQPRLTRPQTLASIAAAVGGGPRIYVQGVASNLKANDPMLIEPVHAVFRVASVTPDVVANRTLVGLMEWTAPSEVKLTSASQVRVEDLARSEALFRPASVPPANARQLGRSLQAISANSEPSYRLFDAFMPESSVNLLQAVQNAAVTPGSKIQAYAFRVKASLFANNLPGTAITTISQVKATETAPGRQVITTTYTAPTFDNTAAEFNTTVKAVRTLALDAEYNQIKFGDWIVVDYPAPATTNSNLRLTHIATVKAVETRTLTFGGVSGKVTLVTISPDIPKSEPLRADTAFLRGTIVYAQSELLPLAEAVIADAVCGGDTEIELDGLYTGLEPGRWLIVAGERSDISGTSGVPATELLMLSEVRHGVAVVDGASAAQTSTSGGAVAKFAARAAKSAALAATSAAPGPIFSAGTAPATGNPLVPLPGDKTHTFIKVASSLAYCYRRDTVRIYGNVVHATHGQTTSESLGNGDASRPFQQFALKQNPLTYVSAATVSGIESTLQVLVNDVRWHESDALAGLNPYDRKFVTKTDDDGKTTVVFGDGVRGARTPSGLDNIRALYRKSIGKGGNLNAAQISQLGDRPLGVQAVVNPLPSTGGADAETRDQGRRNAPLATTALDRLVSTQDYADFARTFAGVSKASSVELPGSNGQVVHVTIAGLDDIPIAESSDLFRNLRTAMIRYGDPLQPLQLAVRDRILLVMSAGVRVKADYLWEKVEPKVRAAVLDVFGFDKRDLGQDAFLSEAIAAMQAVEGVEYVDVDSFGGVFGLKPDGTRLAPSEIAAQIAAIDSAPPRKRVGARLARFTGSAILPAQAAYFAADQPQTLVLNEVKA